MNRKAITLAEIIIVMVIVATIALVFLAMPKKDVGKVDRAKYYVAYNMLTRLLQEQLAESGKVCIKKEKNGENYVDCSFKNQVEKWLNTVSIDEADSSAVLTNGMVLKWTQNFDDAHHHLNVTVDIDGNNAGSCTDGKDCHNFTLYDDGKVSPEYKNDCDGDNANSSYCSTDWISFRVFKFNDNGTINFLKNGVKYNDAKTQYDNSGDCESGGNKICFMEAIRPLK